MENQMFYLILFLVRILFILISGKKKNIILEIMILKKENEILKRKNKKRIKFRFVDKLFYTILNNISKKVKKSITLIKPETVLKWKSN